MAFPLKQKLPLSSGHAMPVVGLGTWQSTEEEAATAVGAALDMGYRHIDTAYNYQNEAFIGKVLKNWLDEGKVKREELYITTKLPGIGMHADLVSHFVRKSLNALQIDYLDCYLVHAPIGFNKQADETNVFPMLSNGKVDLDMNTDLVAIWKALEKEVEAGRIRTIGVSNFNQDQITRVNKAAKIKIAVQQVELHVYFQQKAMREFCNSNNIVIMCYAPLGSPGRPAHLQHEDDKPSLLSHPTVKAIAQAHFVTPAQVLLNYLAQKGMCVIPKSVTPARIQCNYQIFNFTLSPRERSQLEALDSGPEGRTFQVRSYPGAEIHPELPF